MEPAAPVAIAHIDAREDREWLSRASAVIFAFPLRLPPEKIGKWPASGQMTSLAWEIRATSCLEPLESVPTTLSRVPDRPSRRIRLLG